MPTGSRTLETLWRSAAAPAAGANAEDLPDTLPPAARRYLAHALAAGTPLAGAVRLAMHGEIRLRGWRPFRAEQVIRRDGQMIWCARTRLHGLPVSGADMLLDGRGAMDWRLLGWLPVMRASGADITRSAAGRLRAEAVWLPSLLAEPEIRWREDAPGHLTAAFPVAGQDGELRLVTDPAGALTALSMERWGNPDGGAFGCRSFGALVETEGRFQGYSIPTRLRVGWHFDGRGFRDQGEFFRVTVDQAVYR